MEEMEIEEREELQVERAEGYGARGRVGEEETAAFAEGLRERARMMLVWIWSEVLDGQCTLGREEKMLLGVAWDPCQGYLWEAGSDWAGCPPIIHGQGIVQ